MGLSTTYTKAETDFLIQQLEKKSEALYTDDTLAGDIIKRVDINTGENVNYRETTMWHDGSTMNDSKVDGVIYIKNSNKYYKRQYEGAINVKWFGAKGDGNSSDIMAINNAVDYISKIGGGILFFPKGVYSVDYAIKLKSNITYLGEDKFTTIIKSSAISPDNVFGEGYPVYDKWQYARAVGGSIDRLKKPDFLNNYTEEEAYVNGGMAGFGRVNIKIQNLTIDGNKQNTPEGKVNLRGSVSGVFLAGEKVTSNNGATAYIGGAFSGTTGFTLEPSTIIGEFNIGDIVTGETSGATINVAEIWADDAFQMGIRFDGISHSEISDCIIKNTIFTAISIYNASNNNVIKNNLLIDNNLAGAHFPYGNMGIFIEFDARGNTIENNIVKNCVGYGILVQSSGGNNEDTKILNNKVFNCGGDGIRVGNETSNSDIKKVIVKGNFIRGILQNGGCGIRIFHFGSGEVINAVVENNTISYSNVGIVVSGNAETSIINNRIENCNGSSISINSDKSIVLKNNTTIGSDYAIRVMPNNVDCINIIIKNNRIKDYNADGMFIGAENSDKNLLFGEISNNKITNAVGTGKVGIRFINDGTGQIINFDIFKNYIENVDYGIGNFGEALKNSKVFQNKVVNAANVNYSNSDVANNVIFENNI